MNAVISSKANPTTRNPEPGLSAIALAKAETHNLASNCALDATKETIMNTRT